MAFAGGVRPAGARTAPVQHPLPPRALTNMDFRHPHFAEPGWLWLALLSPVCVLLLHRYAALARAKQLGRFASPAMLADLLRSHSPVRRMVKNILLVFGIAAIGLALA